MGGWDIEVLYATDEESAARQLAASRDGWAVETAATVEEAKAALSSTAVDCLVTKYTLPGGDGLDLLEWARAADVEAGKIRTHVGPVEQLFGLPSEEFLGVETVLSEGIHPEDVEAVQSETQEVLDGSKEEFSVVVRTDPGRGPVRWLEAVGDMHDDGQRLGGLTTDVTERERRERELREQNERLKQFTNVVSHDLRSPLQVASNWLELAREDCDSEYLDNIEQAHDRMSVLLEQLLRLAKDGEEALDTEAIDIDSCSNQCWQNVDTGEATLVVNVTETLEAEPSRFQQLLENLFRNSVEHGPNDVVVTVGRLGDGFSLADGGLGIPPDERESVFETGYSTDNSGTGFGLSIVEEVVEAHGWEISVPDSAEGGARFEITGVNFDAEPASFGND